jgi:acetylornithine/N-succinyldiaminopimelate aminotransferase
MHMAISVKSSPARITTRHPHLLANYARAEINIVRGEGVYLFDESGSRYLDLVAGIAVCALGHAHPQIARAVADQAATLVHVSNLYHHEPAGTLADRLAELSGFDSVFFCNSGAEANEAAIKLARKHAYRRGETKRTKILAAFGSFHGRTFGALAATDNPKYKEGFEPLPAGFAWTPFNNVEALDAAIDEDTACFLVEPVQGESGVVPATREFLQAARRICDQRGALLIFDEVQCGMGRLGKLFASQFYGVTPDAFTLAKSLANGLPIGALLIRGEAAAALRPGDHGTTFGGSPVPAAAALEHLRIRDVLDLDAHVARVGTLLHAELARRRAVTD